MALGPTMSVKRSATQAVVLPSGKLLVVSGLRVNWTDALASAELLVPNP
jgi:hypothetical protein